MIQESMTIFISHKDVPSEGNSSFLNIFSNFILYIRILLQKRSKFLFSNNFNTDGITENCISFVIEVKI